MRTPGLAAILAVSLWAQPVHGEELFSYFEQTDHPPEASVTYSPCTGTEVAECISHTLSCEKAKGGAPRLTIIAGDVEKIISSLTIGTKGQVSAQLKLTSGTADLPVTSVEVEPNDMNRSWIATIGVGSVDDFFYALTEEDSEGASLVVAGKRFPLAPQKGDGKKLVAWKNACIALEGQSLPGPTSTVPVKSDVEHIAEIVTLLTKDVAKASDLLKACENTYKPSSSISSTEAIYNTIRCEESLQFGFNFTKFIYDLSGRNTPRICWKEPRNRRERTDIFISYLKGIKDIEKYNSASVLYAFSVEHYKCDSPENAQ